MGFVILKISLVRTIVVSFKFVSVMKSQNRRKLWMLFYVARVMKFFLEIAVKDGILEYF